MPRYWGERITAVAIIGLALFFADMSTEFPAGGGTFPQFAAAGVILLSLLLILDSFVRRTPEAEEPVDFKLSYQRLKPLLLTVLVVVYVLAIFRLGYFAASFLFLVISTLMIGIRNYKAIAVTAAILFPVMYVFFEIFLNANLPQGVLI